MLYQKLMQKRVSQSSIQKRLMFHNVHHGFPVVFSSSFLGLSMALRSRWTPRPASWETQTRRRRHHTKWGLLSAIYHITNYLVTYGYLYILIKAWKNSFWSSLQSFGLKHPEQANKKPLQGIAIAENKTVPELRFNIDHLQSPLRFVCHFTHPHGRRKNLTDPCWI